MVNEKLNEAFVVDSTSKYPLEKETLTEYRARLKKQLYNSSEKTKYSLFQILFSILGILIVLFLILIIVAVNSSSTDINLNDY